MFFKRLTRLCMLTPISTYVVRARYPCTVWPGKSDVCLQRDLQDLNLSPFRHSFRRVSEMATFPIPLEASPVSKRLVACCGPGFALSARRIRAVLCFVLFCALCFAMRCASMMLVSSILVLRGFIALSLLRPSLPFPRFLHGRAPLPCFATVSLAVAAPPQRSARVDQHRLP